MSFCAINEKKDQRLMVIWDLGRKCTFACSYCPPHRKNNWSNTASFDELVKTADDLERYSNLLNQYRTTPFRLSASFTGGEPTVNPDFFPFLEYLQQTYPHWNRTLTTNGFYTERKLRLVMDNTNYSTISYHCEGTPEQRERVRENIRIMNEEGYGFKVNVMFHEQDDLFNECVDLCEWFDEIGVNYMPRVIGDQGDVKQGIKDKTVHTYSDEQMKWLKGFWERRKNGNKPQSLFGIKPKKTNVGQSIGRPCCGDRQMELLDGGEWVQSKFVTNNNFENWSCMINWYFLYIHQEIDKIWFHQTCQVNLDGEVNPASSVSGFGSYIDSLETQLGSGHIPYIRCPKTHCGCGLCVPKAKDDDVAANLFKSHVQGVEPSFMDKDRRPAFGTLKKMVYSFDKKNGNETV